MNNGIYEGYGNSNTRDGWLHDEKALDKAFGPADFCNACGEEITEEECTSKKCNPLEADIEADLEDEHDERDYEINGGSK